MRPLVERYVRATVEAHRHELIGGLEMRGTDDFDELKQTIKHVMRLGWGEAIGAGWEMNLRMVAECVERAVALQWPDRYWFIEIANLDERDGWVQVFKKPEES